MKRTALLLLSLSLAVSATQWATSPALAVRSGSAGSPSSAPAALAAPDINVANVQAHLAQFNTFASQNGGTRRAGTAGYRQSLAYVKAKLQAAGYVVAEQTCNTGCTFVSNNLIADWPGGNTGNTYMFGAHLDGVSAGPGINDNGSGSASLLEVALQLAAANPPMLNHVRFGWWTDEEQGLNGSRFYVNSLSAAQRTAIKGYYNFDMVASRNGGYFINNINSSTAAPLREYWQSLNLAPQENIEGQGRSDDFSFQQGGIPTSGYATGASARKTSAEAAKWGGTAGSAYDPCYHRSCDTTANINATALNRSADGIAFALWNKAVGSVGNDFSISLSPASASVQAGSSVTATVNTSTTSGSAQTVALSASGLPSGATAGFSPSSVNSGGSSSLTISTATGTPAGTYSITVTATGASVTRNAVFTLTVTGPTGGCAGIPAWNASQAYAPGDVASHIGRKWTSTWYSTGAEPGAPQSWAVWSDSGAC